MYKVALDMLLQLSQGNYYELFSLHFLKVTIDTNEYISIINQFLPLMVESESIYEEIIGCRLPAY